MDGAGGGVAKGTVQTSSSFTELCIFVHNWVLGQLFYLLSCACTELCMFGYVWTSKRKKVCFYVGQCPVRWTVQSALHLPPPPIADLFIMTPTRLLREAF